MKNNIINEYMKNDGLNGYAKQCLIDEIKEAIEEKNHPLREAIEAYYYHDPDVGVRLFINALLNAESWSLKAVAMNYIKIPMIKIMFEQAVSQLDSGDYNTWYNFPIEIKIWSAAQIQRVVDEELWLEPICLLHG